MKKNKIAPRIYEGDVNITTDNQKKWKRLLNKFDEINGSLSINDNATLETDNLLTVWGDIFIGINATLKADNLRTVNGYLFINDNATLEADNLCTVDGDLFIDIKATLKADNLRTVNGYLSINDNATLEADNLLTVWGDFFIGINATLKADNLRTVWGDFFIDINATLKADNLRTVNGYLSINDNATLEADNLCTVDGDLFIDINATLKADNLRTVNGSIYIYNGATLKADNLRTVNGDLSIYDNATLEADNLLTYGRDIFISSVLPKKIERMLWKNNQGNRWLLTDKCSEWLLSQSGNIEYWIDSVNFGMNKLLFDKIRKDELTAQEVFAIANAEQRRVAYERMSKDKMKQLKDFNILEERTDRYGNTEKIVQFTVRGYSKPFLYFNCYCPSTGREYFIETDQTTCALAKARSFGFDKEITFTEEW